jgi:hypothetical protein
MKSMFTLGFPPQYLGAYASIPKPEKIGNLPPKNLKHF